jgi:thioredoxin-dependent peroxiredoxin
MALEINSQAPDFTADIENGEQLTLSEYKGKWLVLYFYPKDNTSGCTKEACEFKENMERITSMGAEVIGVSKDTVKSHNNFIGKYELNFHLVADPEKTICELYDVMGEKKMYGKTYMGIIRSTYIIDPEGKIREVYSKVKVAGHVDAVIEKLEELRS